MAQHIFQDLGKKRMAFLLGKLGFEKSSCDGKGGHENWQHPVNGVPIQICDSPAYGTCKEWEKTIKKALGLKTKETFNGASLKSLGKAVKTRKITPPRKVSVKQHGCRGQSSVAAR